MRRSMSYGWLVVVFCVAFLILLGSTVSLAAAQDAAPMSMPTSTPAAAPAKAPAVTVTAAPVPAIRDAFSSGTMRLSIVVGSGYAFNNNYLLIGVGAGYFIANGLYLGLDYESWTGANPGINKLSPRLDYVLNTRGAMRPYAGIFYRRTMIDGLDDMDSVGGRAGLYLMSGKNLYVGAGVVYESYLSCDTATYTSCSDTYPEIVVAFSF